MARQRPEIDYVMVDARNAVLFNEANTQYILKCIREATAHPEMRRDLYNEMAKRFHVDSDKMNAVVIKYADKMKRQSNRRPQAIKADEPAPPADKSGKLDEHILMVELCRQVGHRFVSIQLSQKRGFRECDRCGKHESQYNL